MAEPDTTATAASSRRPPFPDVVSIGEPPDIGRIEARARLIGARIDTRELTGDEPIAKIAAEEGLSFIFRYGVAVTFANGSQNAIRLDAALRDHVLDPVDIQETESAVLVIRPNGDDRIGTSGQIVLIDASPPRLLLVATVLARSVVLARDEVLVSETFDRIGSLVADLRENGQVQLPIRAVMRLAGEVVAARHRVMGTVQADERPDLLWDHPQLDRLYARLEAEYELGERAEVLGRKFAELGDFTEVLLDVVKDKRTTRLEMAIIVLIAFEIGLTLFDMFVR